MFEEKLNEWTQKVIDAYKAVNNGECDFVSTYRMMLDVDKLIAEAFDHEAVMYENKDQ